jgi:hypothetical protein
MHVALFLGSSIRQSGRLLTARFEVRVLAEEQISKLKRPALTAGLFNYIHVEQGYFSILSLAGLAVSSFFSLFSPSAGLELRWVPEGER